MDDWILGESMTLLPDGTWVPTKLIHGPEDSRQVLVVVGVDRDTKTITVTGVTRVL